MLKYGAIGREIVVPLFTDERPVLNGQGAEMYAAELSEWTAKQDVRIRVRLVDRRSFRTWAYEYDRIRAENRAQIRELRKTLSVEDNPELHDEEKPYVLEKGAQETDELMRAVVVASVKELLGVEVDGVALDGMSDPKMLPEILEHTGLLVSAFTAALKAQTPDKDATFC